MADNTKVTFGLGKLETVLKKVGVDSGLIAFGYDAENNHGGAIVAQGKLATPKLLDFKYEDDVLSLYYIKDASAANVEIGTETINIKEVVKAEVAEAVKVDELAEQVIEQINEALQNTENGIGKDLIEAIAGALEDQFNEATKNLEDWAKSEIIQKATGDNPITVTSADNGNGFKTYKIGIEVDGETIKIAEGKLTAIVPEAKVDVHLKGVEFDNTTDPSDPKLKFTFEGGEHAEDGLEVSLKDLIDTYTAAEDGGLVLLDGSKFSLSSTIKADIAKGKEAYEAIFGADKEDDGNGVLPIIDQLRTILSKLDTVDELAEKINDETNGIDKIIERIKSVESTINDETDGVEQLAERVKALEEADNSLIWEDLDDE